MYTSTSATFVVQILAWNFIDLGLCAAGPNQRICIRDGKELKKIFQGNETMPFQWDFNRWPSEMEESPFLDMAERGSVFVDKSLLIEKIMETNEKVVVINAPRRSGKTTNLSMLKDFLEIRIGKNITIRAPSRTSTYRFFTTGKLDTSTDRPLSPFFVYNLHKDEHFLDKHEVKLQRKEQARFLSKGDVIKATYTAPLMIADLNKKIIKGHLARYSIIHLDFKQEPPTLIRYDETLTFALSKRICYFFRKFFRRFDEIHRFKRETYDNVTRETEEVYFFYERMCHFGCWLSDQQVEDAMLWASKMLYLWTGKPVVILVDNYDSLFEDILFKINEYIPKDPEIQSQIKDHIPVLQRFMKKTFVDNPYLAKAVITGTLSVSKKNFFAGISDVKYNNVIDNDLQEFYGFTEHEVKLLFKYFRIPEDLAHQALQFYNGYTMRAHSNTTLYSMESIPKFLNNDEIAEYWVGKLMNVDFRNRKREWYSFAMTQIDWWLNYAPLGNALRPLIAGNDTSISFTEVDYDMEEVLLFTRPRKEVFNVTKRTIDVIFSMLLEIGFFTITEREGLARNENGEIFICVPNEEIRRGLGIILNRSRFRSNKLWHY